MPRAFLKSAILILWTILLFPAVWLSFLCKKYTLRDRLMQIYSATALIIIGFSVNRVGELSSKRPLLVVSNHLSYIDILLISRFIPARFTPKKEIAGWPIIGTICSITGSIFVDRRSSQIVDVKKPLREKLEQGDVVSLFPEATTGNGIHMLPFKSGFFSLAEEIQGDTPLYIQPVAICYTRLNRLPIDSTQWPLIAWYGDMSLLPHVLTLLTLGSIHAELHFLEPVNINEFNDRKALAKHCHDVIENTLETSRTTPKTPPASRKPWSIKKSLKTKA